eukprot:scaffold203169_cov18-Prasinocladus_malaysianus.AAC.1
MKPGLYFSLVPGVRLPWLQYDSVNLARLKTQTYVHKTHDFIPPEASRTRLVPSRAPVALIH